MKNIKKTIAIRGHGDKGAEVIKILERLGGFNRDSVKGTDIDSIYFINNEFEIDRIEYCTQHNTLYQIYTLEEYLESLNQTEQKNDKIQRQLSVDIETAKQSVLIALLEDLENKINDCKKKLEEYQWLQFEAFEEFVKNEGLIK